LKVKKEGLEKKAATMAGRTFRGHIAVMSTTLLFLFNLAVTIGGIASLVLLFVIEHSPSRTGWLLVLVALFTLASGVIGLFSSTRRGCFTLQLILLAFSVIGLIAAALSIFFKPSQVLSTMNPQINYSTALKLLKLDSAILFITFCVQVAVLVLGVCVNCCDLNDYYQDLEMTNQGQGNLARAQAEAERQAARRESSKANQLAEQMKQKYGKWTGEQGV
jgi:outer membrane murein-binding lipoprotein Lpp